MSFNEKSYGWKWDQEPYMLVINKYAFTNWMDEPCITVKNEFLFTYPIVYEVSL